MSLHRADPVWKKISKIPSYDPNQVRKDYGERIIKHDYGNKRYLSCLDIDHISPYEDDELTFDHFVERVNRIVVSHTQIGCDQCMNDMCVEVI